MLCTFNVTNRTNVSAYFYLVTVQRNSWQIFQFSKLCFFRSHLLLNSAHLINNFVGWIDVNLIIYGIQSMFLSKIEFFQKNPAFITMLTGVLIILVVMFFPGGFAQIAVQVKLWFKKKFGKAGKGVA